MYGNLKSNSRSVKSSLNTPTRQSLYGRVVDVILDPFHPEYENKGQSQSINGVFYVPIGSSRLGEEDIEHLFAFQGNSTYKTVPLIGEIVELISEPSEIRGETSDSRKIFWNRVVPLWNHPHHNAYPDIIEDETQESEANLGKYFIEEQNINPLQSFPGDTIIQGRHGQSIRMTGTKFDSNIWIDDSNNGKPLTIISNGQIQTDNGLDNILEDINEDPSSIYLASDHKLDLEQANTKFDAWEKEPVSTQEYKGSQIILNAGRLVFNAKEENVLISSLKGVGINGESLSLDGEKYIGLDATKIYLGKKALEREHEPVLLGQTTIELLEDIISQFEVITKALATSPPTPPTYIAKNIASATSVLPQIPALKKRLQTTLSKKVYTE